MTVLDDALLVVAAIPEELQGFGCSTPDHRGRCSGPRIGDYALTRWAVIGDGASGAATSLGALLDESRCAVLIVGFAGALDPGLLLTSVIAPNRILDCRGEVEPPSERLLSRVCRMVLPRTALFSATALVTEALERTVLHQQTGAGLVDLESAALARVCHQAGVPYAVLRSVTDVATDNLPQILSHRYFPDGRIHRGRLARLAALRPWTWSSLWRLARRARGASNALREAVVVTHP